MSNLDPKSSLSISRTKLVDENGIDQIVTVFKVENLRIYQGDCHSWSKRFILGASATLDIVIDARLVPENRMLTVLPTKFVAHGAGPIFIDLYVGTTYSGGTIVSGANRNNSSQKTTNTIIKLDPTIISDGVKTPFEFLLPSNGIPATASTGGQTGDNLIFIPVQRTVYMFRLVNQEADAANCSFAISIFDTEVQ